MNLELPERITQAQFDAITAALEVWPGGVLSIDAGSVLVGAGRRGTGLWVLKHDVEYNGFEFSKPPMLIGYSLYNNLYNIDGNAGRHWIVGDYLPASRALPLLSAQLCETASQVELPASLAAVEPPTPLEPPIDWAAYAGFTSHRAPTFEERKAHALRVLLSGGSGQLLPLGRRG